MSAYGNEWLHVILRQDDEGDSGWQAYFPKPPPRKKREMEIG